MDRLSLASFPLPAIVAAAVLGSLSGGPVARAQTGEKIGLYIGYGFGVPLSVDRAPGLVNAFESEGRGTAVGHALSAGVELPLGDPLRIGHDAYARLGLAGSSGRYTSPPFTRLLGAHVREYEVEVRILGVDADLRLAFPLSSWWSLEGGAWLSARLLGSWVEWERSIDTNDIPLEDGSDSRIVAEGDSLAAGVLRYGLTASSRFTFPIASLTISPEVYTRLDLPSIGLGLRAFSIGAGLTFKMGEDVPPADPPVPDPSTIPEPEAAKPSRLSASISLGVVGADDGSIVPTVVHHRRVAQFPPYVPFPPGVTDLNAVFHLLARDESLPPDSALVDYWTVTREALNLLGARMSADTTMRIRLVGVAASSEDAMLPMIRAADARRYLASRWGIDSTRVSISAWPHGSDIGPGSSALMLLPAEGAMQFEPVIAEWTTRELRAPRLDLQPEIVSSVGVREWEVTVRHDDRIIARSSSRGYADTVMLALGVRPDAPDSALGQLVAELVAVDTAGLVAVASDTLVLRVDRSRPAIEKQVRQTRMLWEEAGRAGASGSRRMLAEIVSSIRMGDRVTVRGLPAVAEEVAGILHRELARRGMRDSKIDVEIAQPVRRDMWHEIYPSDREVVVTVMR